MLRRVAVSCYQSITMRVTAKKLAWERMTQSSFFGPKYQEQSVPVLQFLTIPVVLNEHHSHGRQGRRQVRNFASLTMAPSEVQSSSSTESSFREDYDDWYSHGRVGHITSEPIDEETDYSKSEAMSPHRGFLLDELKCETPCQQPYDQRAVPASLADYTGPLAMEEGDDDFFDDIGFSDDDNQVLEET